MCQAHSKVTQYKTAKIFHHLKGRGYNKDCVLYPGRLRWYKYFAVLYVTLLWALHTVIKQQFYLHLLFFPICCRCVCLVSVRLAGVNRPSNAGRLEVYYNDVWGTVCDNLFNYRDAHVACHMLGFEYCLFLLYTVDWLFAIEHILNSVSYYRSDNFTMYLSYIVFANYFSSRINRLWHLRRNIVITMHFLIRKTAPVDISVINTAKAVDQSGLTTSLVPATRGQ